MNSISSFELVFLGCTFRHYHTAITADLNRQKSCRIKVINSLFHSGQAQSLLLTNCFNLTAHIVGTTFQSSALWIDNSEDYGKRKQTYELFIYSCVFDNQNNYTRLGQVRIQSPATTTNISITNSTFANLLEGPRTSGMLSQSSIFIVDLKSAMPKTMLITCDGLHFENISSNKEVLYLVSFPNSYKFNDNIVNSTVRNVSSALHVEGSSENSDINTIIINIHNNTFVDVNPSLAQAFYLGYGMYHITSCKFFNSLLEDTKLIYIAAVAKVKFKDCYFESNTTSVQIFAEANSKVSFLENVEFYLRYSKRQGGTVFLYPPSTSKELRVSRSLRIFCPHGYVLNSRKECDKYIIFCSYFTATCEPCPQRTYSLDRGRFFGRNVHNPTCLNCPKNGNCLKGSVKSRPNYWGYRTNKTVRFLQCPPKYCCESYNCKDYNSCHGNRIGTLCGHCATGMSESLFNTKCKSNKDCTSVTFWSAASVYLLLYFAIFLFQEEIENFVRRQFIPRLFLSSEDKQKAKDKGLLKIIFYYYQTLHILLNSVRTDDKAELLNKVKSFLTRSFSFIAVGISSIDCPFEDLRPVKKAIIVHSVDIAC